MKPCRECERRVSEQAWTCPQCGAPYPAREVWDGWGFEYRSRWRLGALPLLHISFKYRPTPVVARGVIAIGQFACGIVTVSQFGLGVVSIGQMVVAWYALAQLAFAYSLIAQVGVYLHQGRGHVVRQLFELIGRG